MNKTENRNPSLDIVRIFAFCSVASIHFFLNTDFYNIPIEKPIQFLMIIPRTFSLVCVPLFIILTGYLMNKKELSKSYYKGIIKTISIYLLASILCYFHNVYFTGNTASLKSLIFSILDFKAAKYSWYIEMYIGLFLLIPFLNLIYNNITSKKQKQVLLFTLILLTVLPSIINTYNFTDITWWQNPSVSLSYNKILPDYWKNIYPITYYFIGAYLKEYPAKVKPLKGFLSYFFVGLCFSLYCFYRSFGHTFIEGEWQSWNALPVTMFSILCFVSIININLKNFSKNTKEVLNKLSNLTLGAFLTSSISDDLIYNFLNEVVTSDFNKQFNYYPICVICVIIFSYLLSYILDIIYKALYKLIIKIIHIYK